MSDELFELIVVDCNWLSRGPDDWKPNAFVFLWGVAPGLLDYFYAKDREQVAVDKGDGFYHIDFSSLNTNGNFCEVSYDENSEVNTAIIKIQGFARMNK